MLRRLFRISSFNTCSSCEEQQYHAEIVNVVVGFQYLLLLRGATSLAGGHKSDAMFQYLLLLRGATGLCTAHRARTKFQYLLLLRGATFPDRTVNCAGRGFNTCSSCEEQQKDDGRRKDNARFNTCSSCEEQPLFKVNCVTRYGFNTCSSCEEQRFIRERLPAVIVFQYLLLLRGATLRN